MYRQYTPQRVPGRVGRRSLDGVDQRSEIREFLSTRRAKITPEQAGLAVLGGHRRVPGLRRAEVAMLAGISVEYYARLERGSLQGASDTVLDAVARALRLDEAEHTHLRDLARTAHADTTARRAPRRSRPQAVRPALQRLLDAMTEAPAVIFNGRLDVLATNRLGRALYAPALTDSARPANFARFQFLNPSAADFHAGTHTTVAFLRAEAGRDPYNRDLTDLIGELSTHSEEFRVLWAAHDVRVHHAGTKTFHHPAVGTLTLAYEAMPLPADPGLTLTTHTAEPGTASHDSLKLLADLD